MKLYPEKVGKGKSYSSGVYLYTCAACGGNGRVLDGSECAWCYGLDADRIIAEMNAGARGQRYYALLKAYLSVRGREIVNAAKAIKEHRGNLTMLDVFDIHERFSLNFKATCEWLEECSVIYFGCYDRFHHTGLKVKDLKARLDERKAKEN